MEIDGRFIITRGVGDDRVGTREGDMAVYEPIKRYEHDVEERGMTDPMMMKSNNISIDHDEDVEMAIQQISKSTSASSASAAGCGAGGAAAYKNVSNEEAAAASLPSKLRQQQRLVSLDVFRGLTVAVCNVVYFQPPLYVSAAFFMFLIFQNPEKLKTKTETNFN